MWCGNALSQSYIVQFYDALLMLKLNFGGAGRLTPSLLYFMSQLQESHQTTSTQTQEEEQTKPSGYLCKLCQMEEPMYPQYWDTGDDCGIYCADCYWEEDSKRKKARREWLHSNPEALRAYQKHVCQVLGLPPLETKSQK
jgi:hypothetical protein